MFSVKGFLIDGDGVLRPTDGKIPWEHYLGLRQIYKYVKMADRGKFPKIGICTGREYGSAESILFDIGIPNWWSIIESGVFLLNRATKTLLENKELTPEKKEAFREITQKRIPPILAKYQDDLFLYPGNQICVAIELQEGSRLTIDQAFEEISAKIDDLSKAKLVRIHRSSLAVDISPFNVDKASGVKFLCEIEGILPIELFGIGDSPGDFPMFETVGHTGCPANATLECQNKVDLVSEKRYAAGVADILYRVTGVRAT